MVAAAVAWIRAKRPTLTGDQVAQAVRLSAPTSASRAGSRTPASASCRSARARRSRRRRPIRPSPTTTSCGSTGARSASPTALFYNGHGHARLRALLDVFEDPADVYRVGCARART